MSELTDLTNDELDDIMQDLSGRSELSNLDIALWNAVLDEQERRKHDTARD